jgi:type VI secretion system secreted protein VgrG
LADCVAKSFVHSCHLNELAGELITFKSSNAHGKSIYAKPTALGTQTAIVVGQDGPLHTDRDHRVQIQYHWQRGSSSSSALNHPNDDNATAQSKGIAGGLWVRVATFDAGANYGSVFIPRVRQEVIVGFMGNDIDRPMIIGAD